MSEDQTIEAALDDVTTISPSSHYHPHQEPELHQDQQSEETTEGDQEKEEDGGEFHTVNIDCATLPSIQQSLPNDQPLSSRTSSSSLPPSSSSSSPPSSITTTSPPIPSSIDLTPSHSHSHSQSQSQDEPTTTPTAASPSPTTPSPTKRKQSNPTRGASVLQKTVSMTRQRDLPPKDKEQERKHLRELDEMLAASKEAEKRRQHAFDAAQAKRTLALAIALPTWESSILPNWRSVLRDSALNSLWWAGTMPVKRRGQLWGLCIGNNLALGKGTFGIALKRAQKAIEDGRYPLKEKEAMEEEVRGTMRKLKLFQEGGALHQELIEILLAYTAWSPEGRGYPKGISYPAALLLLNMSQPEAFLSLINLIEKSFLKHFYEEKVEEKEAFFRIFDTLLADFMPKVYANFSHEQVRPSLYLTPWITTIFSHYLPLDTSTRIFDVFLLEGDSFLFRVSLSLLQILEPRLFNPVREELEAVFLGLDKGAISIVKRERVREGDVEVEPEEVFEEMGVGEDRLFDELGKLDWKEETWDRLVARELPEAD